MTALDKKTTAQPKKDKVFRFSYHFSSFLTVQLLFKCRFVAWQRGLPRKFADCVSVIINKRTSELYILPRVIIHFSSFSKPLLAPSSTLSAFEDWIVHLSRRHIINDEINLVACSRSSLRNPELFCDRGLWSQRGVRVSLYNDYGTELQVMLCGLWVLWG